MVGLVVFISLSLLAVCQAGTITPVPPVLCGAIPHGLFRCLSTPQMIKPSVSAQCDKDLPECEKITCLFRKSGWMDGDKVDKQKFTAYFDQFAKENPAWQRAVDRVKIDCLQGDLPPQGVHLNCPAFDAMQCSFATFIKNAQLSQWSPVVECESVHRFAVACPICPTDCFEPQIPVGSCNACNALPRSP